MSASRSKRAAQNVITGFEYQAMVMILSFVSRKLFIYTLGTEYLGLNGIFTDVLTLLSMADLGFSTAMAYSFYKPLADNDTKKLAALVAFYRKIYNVIALAVLVLGLCFIPFLKYVINTDKEIPNLVIYYLFSLFNVVVSYLMVYKTTILTADQKDFKVVKIRMFTTFTREILRIAVLLLWHNYIVYLAIGCATNLLNNVVASRKAEKEYPFIKERAVDVSVINEAKSRIIENMKSVFIYRVSTTMFSATDNIIISAVVNTAAVGLYSTYFMISSKLLIVEQIIFSAMTASIGNIIVKENYEKRYTVFQSMQSVSFIFCGIITSTFCIMVNDLITVWLGKAYVFPTITVIAITINTYFSCALQPLWIYRDATGLYRKTKYVMLIAAMENIVLSITLGHFIGVAGVIFASAISRITTYCWYEPRLLFKEYFNKGAAKYYVSILMNVVLLGVTIFVIQFFSRNYEIRNWPQLIIKGVLVGVLCTVVFIGAYIRTDGAQNILNRVKALVKKKTEFA